jgi:hypothetical protein
LCATNDAKGGAQKADPRLFELTAKFQKRRRLNGGASICVVVRGTAVVGGMVIAGAWRRKNKLGVFSSSGEMRVG